MAFFDDPVYQFVPLNNFAAIIELSLKFRWKNAARNDAEVYIHFAGAFYYIIDGTIRMHAQKYVFVLAHLLDAIDSDIE